MLKKEDEPGWVEENQSTIKKHQYYIRVGQETIEEIIQNHNEGYASIDEADYAALAHLHDYPKMSIVDSSGRVVKKVKLEKKSKSERSIPAKGIRSE